MKESSRAISQLIFRVTYLTLHYNLTYITICTFVSNPIDSSEVYPLVFTNQTTTASIYGADGETVSSYTLEAVGGTISSSDSLRAITVTDPLESLIIPVA